jgi:hypothetical protein
MIHGKCSLPEVSQQLAGLVVEVVFLGDLAAGPLTRADSPGTLLPEAQSSDTAGRCIGWRTITDLNP